MLTILYCILCLWFLSYSFIFSSQVEAENPVEVVLVMTVEPGFGGQKFMPEMMDKVFFTRFSILSII